MQESNNYSKIFGCGLTFLRTKSKNSMWEPEIQSKSRKDYDPYQYVYDNIDNDISPSSVDLLDDWEWE